MVVVRAAQRATLIGHHGPASVVVFTSSAWCMSGSHLGNKGAGWRAGVGVGVTSMVHTVGVVVLIQPVSPDEENINAASCVRIKCDEN